jgi:biopolymer transport protein ExbD
LVAPNALKLLLPESNNQTAAKPITTISITQDLTYYINDDGTLKRVAFQEIEPFLKNKYGVGNDEIYISLHAEKTVPWEEVVKIMNIARKNKYKLIAATAPEN